MNKQQLEEVLFCLSDQRTVYHYFKDKYCLFLLSQYITEPIQVKDLKRSPWAHLCQKPKVKEWLAQMGSARIDPAAIDQLWSPQLHHFTLTLGRWGGDDPEWQQTCRPGHNLVLQMNFPASHDRVYRRMIQAERDLFSCWGHPTHDHKKTMAWARLDLSEDYASVLIEEIQNDWLRYAKTVYQKLKQDHSRKRLNRMGLHHWFLFEAYYETYIEPLHNIWHEAMLCAVLEYVSEHLGVSHVYLHEHQTGVVLKDMGDWEPPKSLYSQLPKKFGFQLTEQGPDFILADRHVAKKIRRWQPGATPKWYFLNLNQEELKHAC